MWLHGAANFTILLGATGRRVVAHFAAAQRRRRRRSVWARARSRMYTAYLGGEMVYAHGVGVRTMPWIAPTGVRQQPIGAVAAAPGTFLRDAVKGFAWLVRRTVARVLRAPAGQPGAFGIERIDRPDGLALGQHSDEAAPDGGKYDRRHPELACCAWSLRSSVWDVAGAAVVRRPKPRPAASCRVRQIV